MKQQTYPDYKNWIPEWMRIGADVLGVIGVGVCLWMNKMYYTFSYDGKRKLSKTIVEGTAEYVTLPEGGVGLDVGCGSGALTIACAKKNPQGTMVGIDRWGKEYMDFSNALCVKNAEAEGVADRVSFRQGDACKLDFPDETFDAVTSNYVYHNIAGKDKQELLRETLRVLKKGGTFAIHDIMSPARYGDMDAFVAELKAEGYEDVQLIDTTRGKFIGRAESMLMDLAGSKLLVGTK